MKQISKFLMILAIGNQSLAMNQKRVTSLDYKTIKVEQGNFIRTYEYDATSKRWKLKNEIHHLLRSSGNEEVTKVYIEKSRSSIYHIEVVVSTKINTVDGMKPVPDRLEQITSTDYEAFDYKGQIR